MNAYNSLYSALKSRHVLLSVLSLLVILTLGAIARGWTAWPLVFVESGNVRLLGADPMFHVRHAFDLLQSFPVIERWDHYATFPEGIKNDATGVFNLLISGTTLIIFGPGAELIDVTTVAVWVAFAMGLGCSLLLYSLSRQFMTPNFSILSVAIFTLFPGSYLERSLLGFADQHVAEVFLGLWLTLSLVKLVRITEQDSKHKHYQAILMAMLPFILLAYTWLGALLYLPILAITLFIYSAARINANHDILSLRNNLTAFSLGIVIVFAIVHFTIPWLEMAPRSTRWLIFGTAGLGVCAFAFLSMINAHSPKKRKAILISTAIVTLLLTTIFMLVTDQGQAISDVLLKQRDTFIAEQTEVTISIWFSLLGMAGILAVIGSATLIVLIFQKRTDNTLLVPVIIGICWHIIWFQTGDFGYVVPPFCAFISSLALSYLFSNRYKIIISVLLIVITIGTIWPLSYTRPPWLSTDELRAKQAFLTDWYDAANWIKSNSPEITWTEEKPDYGIIAAWDFGNIVALYSQRIPAWSRYPSPYIHHWLTAQTEADSLDWLCPECQGGQKIRYAMVDAKSFSSYFVTKSQMANKTVSLIDSGKFKTNDQELPKYQYDETYHNSLIYRLFANDGNALSHYRLVYETPQKQFVTSRLIKKGEDYQFNRVAFPITNHLDKLGYEEMANSRLSKRDNAYFYDGNIYSGVKIFEVVDGAKVNGMAPPGTELKVELSLKARSTEREFIYQQTVKASESGHYKLVLPYPTEHHELDKSDVIATSSYLLSIKIPGQKSFTPSQHFEVAYSHVYKTPE